MDKYKDTSPPDDVDFENFTPKQSLQESPKLPSSRLSTPTLQEELSSMPDPILEEKIDGFRVSKS